MFPGHNEPRSSWVGQVLRIQVYPPLPSGRFVQADKANEAGMLARYAVVVTKRLSDSAVMRNTFKRRVMAAIERNMLGARELPYQKYIVFPLKHLRMITRLDIEEDMTTFFNTPRSAA